MKRFLVHEAGQMPHVILLPGSPHNDAWRHQEKSQDLRTYMQRHETASAWESRQTWAEMSMVYIPAPSSIGSILEKTFLTQCPSDQADATTSYSRTVTVTGYVLISQARNNFLISACAQTHCACICLQSEVPSTIPVAP